MEMGRAPEVKQGTGCLIWIASTMAAVWAFAEAQQRTGLMLLAVAGSAYSSPCKSCEGSQRHARVFAE
jgi:hypothetical protein